LTGNSDKKKCVVAVRVRGTISALREARETLKLLNLTRNNYAVLINDSPSFLGMLKAAQSFITWGEASKATIALLLKERGKFAGNKKLTEEKVQKAGYESINDLVEAVFNCSVDYWKLPNIQPIFRLHPPTKGFKGKVKKSFRAGGASGYRGDKINDLVERMV